MATTDNTNYTGPGYPGNKNVPGLIQKIVNEIPACSTVMELFAGSAGLTRFLINSNLSKTHIILLEKDRELLDKTFNDIVITNEFKNGSCDIGRVYADAFKFLKVMESDQYPDRTFVFCDPPYMLHTRANKKLYKHEFTDQDHVRFLDLVLKLKCNVMIIHPICELYESKLASFRKVQIKVRYRQKTATECLYMNYPPPEKKLILETTGKDCWDRQRIKRKGDRTVKKLLSLPTDEKNYILNRIKTEVYGLNNTPNA